MTPEEHAIIAKCYGRLYTALVRLLAEHDLLLLVQRGAPAHEYRGEVAAILSRLPTVASAEETGQVVYDVFLHSFGKVFVEDVEPRLSQRKQQCTLLGEDVWTMWNHWHYGKEKCAKQQER